MKNGFLKGHGLGNEYIVVDPAELPFELTPGRIARICDRDKGVGSDGVLTLEDPETADFGVRIWNPDGSEAETSGNGLRILACYLHATGRTRKKSLTIETPGGPVQVEAQVDSTGAVCAATVHMGRATFSPETLPCTHEVDEAVERANSAGGELIEQPINAAGELAEQPTSAGGELIEQPINVAGETLIFTGVSVGNPHCVVFHPEGRRWTGDDTRRRDNLVPGRSDLEPRRDELLRSRDDLRGRRDELPQWHDDSLSQRDEPLWSRDDLLRLGPALENHPIFPRRANVQLAERTGRDSIRILIWERGAGETLSSGSSACAAASVAVRLGLVKSPVTVESPGGELLVDVDEGFYLMLTGPVAEIARGTFSEAMLREILDTDPEPQTT